MVTEQVCSRCTSLEGLGGSKPWQTSMFVSSKLLLLLLLHVHVYSLFENSFQVCVTIGLLDAATASAVNA